VPRDRLGDQAATDSLDLEDNQALVELVPLDYLDFLDVQEPLVSQDSQDQQDLLVHREELDVQGPQAFQDSPVTLDEDFQDPLDLQDPWAALVDLDLMVAQVLWVLLVLQDHPVH
jgi:hypothetical protein